MLQDTSVKVADGPTSTVDRCLDEPPVEAAWRYFKAYAREKPEVVAMWAFGAGFVMGWKLKLW
jgi:hypothetical protein